MTTKKKEELKRLLINSLISEKEIEKIVLFGSFISAANPHDIDIAIFQNSDSNYLELAMKYRKLTRSISKHIPLDIIPLKAGHLPTVFGEEIATGEVVYERGN